MPSKSKIAIVIYVSLADNSLVINNIMKFKIKKLIWYPLFSEPINCVFKRLQKNKVLRSAISLDHLRTFF